jgi:hypothetical protein
MKTIQQPISNVHKSSMFFDGVVATGEKDGKKYELRTQQIGEITIFPEQDELSPIHAIGEEIRKLGDDGVINDNNIEEGDTVDICVDNFLVIAEEGDANYVEDEERIFNYYDEAIEAFKKFLR